MFDFKPIFKGSYNARVMLVGEYLGAEEVAKGQPFVGTSGWKLDEMARLAKLDLSSAFYTNILHRVPLWNSAEFRNDIEMHFVGKRDAKARGLECINGRYPDEEVAAGRAWVLEMMEKIKPNLVILLGNTALWALGGKEGITKWRGSIFAVNGQKFIAMNNPALIDKDYSARWVMIQDMRRAAPETLHPEVREPPYHFTIRPNFTQAMDLISSVRGKVISNDIETRRGQISCFGIGTSATDAFCIPFMCVEGDHSYWNATEEFAITTHLRDVLTDKNTFCITQGGVYDAQYTAKQWGFIPNILGDTMIAFRVCFPSLKKSLDFISSIVCDFHAYWKDEGREWDPRTMPEEQHWAYNCKDCAITWEAHEKRLLPAIRAYGLEEPYRFEMRKFWPAINMAIRGCRIDTAYKNSLKGLFLQEMQQRSIWYEKALGHPLNPNSSAQLQRLFYDDFKIKPVIHRKTKKRTLDDEALEMMIKRQPLTRPLVEKIQESRSLKVFSSNYAEAKLDADDRIRCTFHFIPETFRFSSSKNAFDTGANLQTIPKGTEDE